jgi:hypothetical protein
MQLAVVCTNHHSALLLLLLNQIVLFEYSYIQCCICTCTVPLQETLSQHVLDVRFLTSRISYILLYKIYLNFFFTYVMKLVIFLHVMTIKNIFECKVYREMNQYYADLLFSKSLSSCSDI